MAKDAVSLELVHAGRDGALISVRIITFDVDGATGARSVKDIMEWTWTFDGPALCRRMARKLAREWGYDLDEVDLVYPEGMPPIPSSVKMLSTALLKILDYKLSGSEQRAVDEAIRIKAELIDRVRPEAKALASHLRELADDMGIDPRVLYDAIPEFL